MNDYDVIVLGGGSAGTSAAGAAADAGARTALVNEGELGGLCILRGCMPTKAMLASAHAAHAARHTDAFGVSVAGEVIPDFERIMQRRAGQVERFKRAKVDSIHRAEYTLLRGRARFVDERTVSVDGAPLTAAAFVVATGSAPTRPEIDGIDDVPVWTSDDVMALESQPECLLVQGTGAIGLELGQFFARIGTQVTIVGRSPLLGKIDPMAGTAMAAALAAEPSLDLLVPARILTLRRRECGLEADVEHEGAKKTIVADALLVATGRRANLDGLNLAAVGLEPSGSGGLEHDDTMRTPCASVWIAGDATGTHQILHLANEEGRVAGHNAAGGAPARQIDRRLFMQAIFTDPPFAQVGLSEIEAGASGRDTVIGSVRFGETGRAITMGETHGVWQLVVDRASGEILGSTIVGPRADDLIHIVMALMSQHARAADVLELPWYHPTLSEVILDVARDAERRRL